MFQAQICATKMLVRRAVLALALVGLATAAQAQTKSCTLLHPCSTPPIKPPKILTWKPPVSKPQPPQPGTKPDVRPPFPKEIKERPSAPRVDAPRPSPYHETRTANGSVIRRSGDGKIREMRDPSRGLDVHYGSGGRRTVSVERADHSRVVAYRGGRGYIERPYTYGGHEFGRRTYYDHGRSYDRYYRPYEYHGVVVNVYAPAVYYPPAFYGWAYSPWGPPVVYTDWGWAGTPWYGVYGATLAPYPDYSGAVQWLTDYMIAANLQEAYAAQVAAQVAAVADPYASPLSPDVKQMILNEVRQDLALENSEAQQNAQGQEIDPASSSIARTLADPQPHVFVAGGDLDLVTVSGQSCPVSEGDVLEVMQEPPDSATTATATVLFAKGVNECTRGVSVEVELADLQEMQNHLRATIDEGLGEMKAKAGSSGISAPPAPARMAPVKPAFAAIAPPPDPNAATEIQEADAQAGQAEQDVSGRAGGSGGPSAPPDPVPAQFIPAQPALAQPASANQSMPSRGQTKEEVTAAFGEPAQVAPVSGGMEVDLYKGFEVIFRGGTVVAVVPMPIGSAPQ